MNKITIEDINNKSVKELKQYCRDNKIKGFSKLNKQKLIDMINDFHKKDKVENKGQEKGINKKEKEEEIDDELISKMEKVSIDIVNENDVVKKEVNIKNRGTGAGGANTNKNGLDFERIVDLKKNCIIVSTINEINEIKFKGTDKIFIEVPKKKLQKYMKSKDKMNTKISIAHGCKEPDEAYIDEDKKVLFIIEKKYQQCNGSACEKIQTGLFKRGHYGKIYPEYKIEYIYCLSNWFIENCVSEIEYLNEENFKIFFGEENIEENIKDIIKFITSY